MDVYLIRHGEAVPLETPGVERDEDRMLTERGHEQARAVGRALRERGVHFDRVVTSPLVRARETVDGLLDGWDSPPEVLVRPELAPDFKKRKLSRYVWGLGLQSVALVGHEPDLSGYAAWLAGCKRLQIALAKGGVIYLACDGLVKGDGVLKWLLPPELLGGPANEG